MVLMTQLLSFHVAQSEGCAQICGLLGRRSGSHLASTLIAFALLDLTAPLFSTRLIEALHAGHLPAWQDHPAPGIAVDYWRLPANAKLLDVIYAVRSDESTHRFVNHSLANLEPQDINPFALGEPDMHIKGTKTGFERGEAAAYVRSNQPTRPA